MSHYLLSVHTSADAPPAHMSDDVMRDYAARIDALEAEMREASALVFSGRLNGPDTASVIRARNGTVVATDGPFLESKEAIGGFYIIEAPSPDEAKEWATKTAAVVGMPIELRPFQDARRG